MKTSSEFNFKSKRWDFPIILSKILLTFVLSVMLICFKESQLDLTAQEVQYGIVVSKLSKATLP